MLPNRNQTFRRCASTAHHLIQLAALQPDILQPVVEVVCNPGHEKTRNNKTKSSRFTYRVHHVGDSLYDSTRIFKLEYLEKTPEAQREHENLSIKGRGRAQTSIPGGEWHIV